MTQLKEEKNKYFQHLYTTSNHLVLSIFFHWLYSKELFSTVSELSRVESSLQQLMYPKLTSALLDICKFVLEKSFTYPRDTFVMFNKLFMLSVAQRINVIIYFKY